MSCTPINFQHLTPQRDFENLKEMTQFLSLVSSLLCGTCYVNNT